MARGERWGLGAQVTPSFSLSQLIRNTTKGKHFGWPGELKREVDRDAKEGKNAAIVLSRSSLFVLSSAPVKTAFVDATAGDRERERTRSRSGGERREGAQKVPELKERTREQQGEEGGREGGRGGREVEMEGGRAVCETSSDTEEVFNSSQDLGHPIDKEPLSCQPPPPPSSSLPSAESAPSDQAFLQAAAIFQQLRMEKPVTQQLLHYGQKTDAPLPESEDKITQRQAYQLAFSTLKYQELLEDVMTDSCFHTSQHITTDMLPLAMVMLFDFQDRKFLLRQCSTKEGQEPLQEVRDLESSLRRCKTKLAASLARCRVKQRLQSISCFLVDSVRSKQHQAKSLPHYAWVNTLKYSIEEVCEVLQSVSLREVKNMTELQELTFCRDPLCPDTLVFSKQLHAWLQENSLTITHTLKLQDRSVCLAVTVLRPLLYDDSDVLLVGSFSPVTVAHIAVVASTRSGRVLICGADHTPSQIEDMRELLAQMNMKNFRVLSETFCGLNEWNNSVQRLKVIIVLPQCSSSALNDPIPTMHSEHGDWELLQDLCHDSVSKSKMNTMTSQQARQLGHALSFPKVQTVVYCTRSVYPEENEQLVKRVLEKTHTHHKLLPFRVNGPIFPDDSQSGDTADSKFFRLEPSQFTNGCFIARLSRQADPTKVETVQDVLARAAAKGLLGGIIPEQSKPGKKGKSKKSHQTAATSKPSSASSQGRSGTELMNEQDSEREEEEGKLKQHPKQTQVGTKSKTNKKKPKKKKVNYRRLTKTKPRRIPRLTLSLMSFAKASARLSLITPLVKKLRDQQSRSDSPASAGKHPSSVHPAAPSHHTGPEPEKVTLKDAGKAGSTLKAQKKMDPRGKDEATHEDLKPSDVALPDVSSKSCSSLSSRSDASVSRQNSSPQFAQTSAKSSNSQDNQAD
ncbi:LOW QUALITY PROTEIN: putative methyltransferase NSUN7 [Sphaeramia orbicularis]|uniref:LOW QUALITY PROTEIN: putative methyltransferase NSUN7 n=1 Tax=Sphaeramia orbicularis TaxID=375764 RepID=UPI00117F55C2|nr:LOW QUALITY PROTEIN: putative methyltransferase NSUN7 [Sphaeramia orbicularis]